MKDRIKKIRKELDLTQQEFADRIKIKRGGVANYEIGRNKPADSVISLICREFNVNEDWLRNGTGDMFLPADRNADIAKLTNQLLNEESDSFKNKFVSMLANLTVDEWEFLEHKAGELCGISYEKELSDKMHKLESSSDNRKKTKHPSHNLTRKELHAALDRELDLQETTIKSEVLPKSG